GLLFFVKIVDQFVNQAVPVDPRLEMKKPRTEPDCGAVHKDKGARRSDAAKPADVAVHLVDQTRAVFGRSAATALFLDQPRPVVQQRSVDKGGPAVQYRDHLVRQV